MVNLNTAHIKYDGDFEPVNNLAKILSCLSRFVQKHDLEELGEDAINSYFQCDHIFTEGANEVFPEILELFLKECE